VLVFCAGRKASQNCAELLRRELHTRVGPPSASAAAARADLIEKLRIDLSGSTDPAFDKLLGRWCNSLDESRPSRFPAIKQCLLVLHKSMLLCGLCGLGSLVVTALVHL
jgi:hypothetical protein